MTKDSNNKLKEFTMQQLAWKFSRCFWPKAECQKKAIRAHSIQNRKVLDALVRKGHVVMPQIRIDFDSRPSIEFREVGRNQATTFTGLCAVHDNLLFGPIDNSEINLDNYEQLFLLSYRSVLKELHTSMKAAVDVQSTFSKGVELGKFDPNDPSLQMLLATEKLIAAHQMYIYN